MGWFDGRQVGWVRLEGRLCGYEWSVCQAVEIGG